MLLLLSILKERQKYKREARERQSRLGVFRGPFSTDPHRVLFVLFPMRSYVVCQRVVLHIRVSVSMTTKRKREAHRIRSRKESLYREQDGPYLERRAPSVFENVEADSSELVNVGMVNLGQESNFRRSHRVLFWQEQFELECAACPPISNEESRVVELTLEGRRVRTGNQYIKVTQILFVRRSSNPWR